MAAQAAPITDADGYTFSVIYDYTPNAFVKDVASEKPGFNSIRIRLQSTITVTNTTAGRTLSFRGFANDDVTFALLAQWPGSSAVCKAIHPSGTAPCSIELAHTRPGNELAVRASSTSQTYAGARNYDAGLAHIPDADYDAVLAGLKAPASYAVTYTGGDDIRFKNSCPDPDLTAYLAQAFAPGSAANGFNGSLLPIYDTSGTCHATLQLAQPDLQ